MAGELIKTAGENKQMPKQYVHALIEPKAKKRLEQLRFDLCLPSLSATVDYLIDNLPKDKRKYRKEKRKETG